MCFVWWQVQSLCTLEEKGEGSLLPLYEQRMDHMTDISNLVLCAIGKC